MPAHESPGSKALVMEHSTRSDLAQQRLEPTKRNKQQKSKQKKKHPQLQLNSNKDIEHLDLRPPSDAPVRSSHDLWSEPVSSTDIA